MCDSASQAVEETSGADCKPHIGSSTVQAPHADHPASRAVSPQCWQGSAGQADHHLQQGLSSHPVVDTKESNIQPGRIPLPCLPSLLRMLPRRVGRAHWEDIRLAGSWTPVVARHLINLPELWTIHLAPRHIRTELKGQAVTVQCVNMSVESYRKKQVGHPRQIS